MAAVGRVTVSERRSMIGVLTRGSYDALLRRAPSPRQALRRDDPRQGRKRDAGEGEPWGRLALALEGRDAGATGALATVDQVRSVALGVAGAVVARRVLVASV